MNRSLLTEAQRIAGTAEDARIRRERAQAIIEHNREMQKLRSNGAAHRDRLLAARINLRREA